MTLDDWFCFYLLLVRYFLLFVFYAGALEDMVFPDELWAKILSLRVLFSLFVPGVRWVPVRSGVGLILLQNRRVWDDLAMNFMIIMPGCT